MSPYGWTRDFPPVAVFAHTERLVAHPQFRAAKRGDLAAARQVVHDLAGDWQPLESSCRAARPAAIAAVLSPEETTGNQLPRAFAQELQQRLDGLPILPVSVCKPDTEFRTKGNAVDRFLRRPKYSLRRENLPSFPVRMPFVLMLDDVVTTGGSLSELRRFLLREDFWPVAAVALVSTPSRSAGDEGTCLVPGKEARRALLAKHPQVSNFLKLHGIYEGDVASLTTAELRLLLRMSVLPV